MKNEQVMLEADYLVIGAGAQGMAFTDELIHNTTDTTVIVIDKHSKPGGHWNDAYDFVTLHQPSSFYGVNSKPLEKHSRHFATSFEILAYHEEVMKDLVSSGRVKFFFQCEYVGNESFHSMIAEHLEYKVNVKKRTVDGTYTGPTVPSTSKPRYIVADGVHIQPINGLARIQSPWKRYLIIGGGKSGIDAVLYLLNKSVNPDHISWVIPNDFWLLNREVILPDKFSMDWFNCILNSNDCNEFCKNAEKCKIFLRLDTSIEPTRFKAGTVTINELEKLRLVKDVIRKGRINCIEKDRIIFENGEEVDTDESTLHVDCSASGCQVYAPRNIWEGNNIILQDVTMVQSCYSASVIAAIEVFHSGDDEEKNELLTAIKHPQVPSDIIEAMITEQQNNEGKRKVLGFMWMRWNRLTRLYHVSRLDFLRFFMWAIFNKTRMDSSLKKLHNAAKDKMD